VLGQGLRASGSLKRVLARPAPNVALRLAGLRAREGPAGAGRRRAADAALVCYGVAARAADVRGGDRRLPSGFIRLVVMPRSRTGAPVAALARVLQSRGLPQITRKLQRTSAGLDRACCSAEYL
jgi:hypothetical protein